LAPQVPSSGPATSVNVKEPAPAWLAALGHNTVVSAFAGLAIATKPNRATAAAEKEGICLKNPYFSDFIDILH
jgi:hypothetical protein